MVTKCPKCQTTLTFEFQHLENGSEISCEHCEARLKMTVVPEIIIAPSSPLLSPQTSLQEAPPKDSKGTILLCIDGEATREVMKALLETHHYFVIDIPSGGTAFTKMQNNPPALAFVDSGLSDMPGAELCQKIKHSPDLSKTIVILVGSMFEKNTKYRREAPDLADADDYIDRHEIQKGLLNKVEKHLSKEDEVVDEKLEDVAQQDSFETSLETPSEVASASDKPEVPSSAETERAKHFAETIVSDIVRFNDRKVEEGLRDGDFYEILADEIKEGRDFYHTKVSQVFWPLNYYEEVVEKFVRENKQKYGQKNSETTSPPPEKSEQPVNQEGELDESSYLVKGARRLAKIIVSDIVIYNESKVAEGLKKGTFYELLENEISEGRQLYESRVDKSLYYAGIYEQALEAFIEETTSKKTQNLPQDEPAEERPEQSTKPERETGLESKPEDEPECEAVTEEDEVKTSVESSPETSPLGEDIEDRPILESNTETLEKAREIAKEIVSEIMETHSEKTSEGLKKGTLLEILSDELMAGRQKFEAKVPAYFDSSIFEETIENFIASKTEDQQGLASEIEEAVSESTKERDDAWQSPPAPETEAPQDVFQEMESQAQEFAQEPEPILEESAWESSETPETEAPQDVFQEMESQAQGLTQEPEPVLEESAWESPETPETEAPQDVFQEMESQAQEFDQAPEPVLEDSAWESPATLETEAPQDVFQEMEGQAQEFAQEPEPVLEESAWESPATPETETPQDVFQELENQAQEIIPQASSESLVDSPQEEVATEADSAETKNAKRLAKIIVSDIIIYNEEKVEKGLQNGTFYELLEDDIQEGRVLFESRVSQTLFEAGLYENALEEFIKSRTGTQNKNTPDSQKDTEVHQKIESPEVLTENGTDAIEESKEEKDAKRLANIIVSDIMIYNEEKVEKGLQNDTFYEILEDDIREGRVLFESRVSQTLFEAGLFENALENFINSRKGTQNESIPDSSQETTAIYQKVESPEALPENKNKTLEESKEEKDAKRLANIIVSDIMIYNEKKVEKGLQNGTFYEILEDDIREGTALYESRVSPKILEEKDYLKEALADFVSKRTASLS